jgi:hypothetical protein
MKTISSMMFFLMSTHSVSSVFASNPTQFPVCNYNEGAVIAVTFLSNEDCLLFENTVTAGAAEGYAYGNCSLSTYCLTFKTAGSLVLENRGVAALSATSVGGTKIIFPSVQSCLIALNATSTNGDTPECEGDVLYIPEDSGSGSDFSVSVEGLNVTGISAHYTD